MTGLRKVQNHQRANARRIGPLRLPDDALPPDDVAVHPRPADLLAHPFHKSQVQLMERELGTQFFGAL